VAESLELLTPDPIPTGRAAHVSVSVIVPVTGRHGNLAEVYSTHAEVLRRTSRSFEFVFVCDGGFETAADPLRTLQQEGEPIRVLRLSRVFGEATALMVGFRHARADIVVTLAAYLQVAPEGTLDLLDVIDRGADVAVASRTDRRDPIINRLQHHAFRALINWFVGIPFDISCGLKAIRRRVTQEMHLYGDLYRFLPLLAHQRGFRVIEIPVKQHPQDTRTRVYRPGVYLNRLLDIVTVAFLFKFTRKPLRFFGLIGMALFAAGLLTSLVLAGQRLFGGTALADRPLLLLGVLLMVLGVQVGSIGLLGELIVFTHARRMKDYSIDTILK
jgi:glycosyltransferase involved in cell wall biosynthesis